MKLDQLQRDLAQYDGPPIHLMEVCGTHTASLFRNGIGSILSPKIKLISGPGCPVCVTPTSYIDRCILLATKEQTTLYSFGDMLRVPGSLGSLSQKKAEGYNIELMHSPLQLIKRAICEQNQLFIVAAVGFETTAPLYALLMQEVLKLGLTNVRFLTSIKRMIPALEWICKQEPRIDGFISPGHVSAIIGSHAYQSLAQKYQKPFVIAGFEGEHLLIALHNLVEQILAGTYQVANQYPEVVKEYGNQKAMDLIHLYFETGPAVWRGLGGLPNSAYYLKREFSSYDIGSRWGLEDSKSNPSCRCDEIIIGRLTPAQCPLLGNPCSPSTPIGPCMVSSEGTCGLWYRHHVMGGEQH